MSENPRRFVLTLAQELGDQFATLPEVAAVVMGGSQSFELADHSSDLDLYVYYRDSVSLEMRRKLAESKADAAEIDNRFFEMGDEWRDRATGLNVDITYREIPWIEHHLERVLVGHQASLGYSTAIWHNVIASNIFFDRAGWFYRLQQAALIPYPEGLRRAIIAKNHPMLRRAQSAYLNQLSKAFMRQDSVSINHRAAALLASYFDILFALNHLPHPGEKRLIDLAYMRCQKKPEHMRSSLKNFLANLCGTGEVALAEADALLDGLDDLLKAEGAYPEL